MRRTTRRSTAGGFVWEPARMRPTSSTDRADFERTTLPLMHKLYGAACRLVGADEARDLVQETYLRAYRTFAGFEAGTNCKA